MHHPQLFLYYGTEFSSFFSLNSKSILEELCGLSCNVWHSLMAAYVHLRANGQTRGMNGGLGETRQGRQGNAQRERKRGREEGGRREEGKRSLSTYLYILPKTMHYTKVNISDPNFVSFVFASIY